MFKAIYTGMSGMAGFSKGLDLLSSNIANLNTPGFKGSELSFRDLFYQYTEGGASNGSSSQMGNGVDASTTRLRFRQGELRDTGNPLEVAVSGNGFLVLKEDDEYFYTRAGQFEFDKDGYLVERVSGGRVMMLDGVRNLQEVNIAEIRTSPPSPTSRVEFTGIMTRTIDPNTGSSVHDIDNVKIYDSVGTEHTLALHFTSTTPGVWTVEVREPAVGPNTVLATGTIKYAADGTPEVGFNSFSFDFLPAGGQADNITMYFGEPGSFLWTTGFGGGTTSGVSVLKQDGYPIGALTTATFDERGFLKLSYGNGQTVTGDRLALAWFNDLQGLTQLAGSMFANRSGQVATLNGATEGAMGKIEAGKIEGSNVDLTEQFSDMIIIQRGYQASSQVTTVANEMLQQLMDLRRR